MVLLKIAKSKKSEKKYCCLVYRTEHGEDVVLTFDTITIMKLVPKPYSEIMAMEVGVYEI